MARLIIYLKIILTCNLCVSPVSDEPFTYCFTINFCTETLHHSLTHLRTSTFNFDFVMNQNWKSKYSVVRILQISVRYVFRNRIWANLPPGRYQEENLPPLRMLKKLSMNFSQTMRNASVVCMSCFFENVLLFTKTFVFIRDRCQNPNEFIYPGELIDNFFPL